MSINSFLQECKAAKEKYFEDQEVDLITYSVQPKNLDDMVSAEFENKHESSRSSEGTLKFNKHECAISSALGHIYLIY